MDLLSQILGTIDSFLTPILVVSLLGTGIFLTLRLGFIQFRRLGHGFAVTSGKYDDPNEPGDVSHFQALTTALSATVGIGNIAGVAIAIHWGGPGAVFWMWMTALLGMAVKYSEVTLAQHFREVSVPDGDGKVWEGTVSGGPMYYIERGLGKNWKPMAIFFAFMLLITSFFTGNAIQANTVATSVAENFGIDPWITGATTALLVGLVILGGITRIGAVTGILAPLMAGIYVFGALIILVINAPQILPTFGLIFSEAFNPTAGVAGTGIGALLFTLTFGVQRGLFSNEAGQGSAPIAHSAAKTDEPVSEGVVALLEPFIDTIIICTMTALVILVTGVWNDRVSTVLNLTDVNIVYVEIDETGTHRRVTPAPAEITYRDGEPVADDGTLAARLGFYNVGVDRLYADAAQTEPFSGIIYPRQNRAVAEDGTTMVVLHGDAVRSSSPLTSLGFQRGLEPLGLSDLGRYIVLLSVLLFGISTSISWSYYGDRCAMYLWGKKAILPFKMVFVLMHFVGATLAVTTIWDIGDTALSLVTIPNVLALLLLSGLLKKITDSYFERKPWEENAIVHKRIVEERKARKEQGRK
jgi:alanine or glycine:cation symporter, AGCS family